MWNGIILISTNVHMNWKNKQLVKIWKKVFWFKFGKLELILLKNKAVSRANNYNKTNWILFLRILSSLYLIDYASNQILNVKSKLPNEKYMYFCISKIKIKLLFIVLPLCFCTICMFLYYLYVIVLSVCFCTANYNIFIRSSWYRTTPCLVFKTFQ